LSELIGRELTPSLYDLLSRRMATVVVGTIDHDGHPHTAPYNQIYAMDCRHLRLAINRQDATYQSLCQRGLAMIEVLEEGDIAVGLKGQARVVAQNMEANCNLALVEIEVTEVKRDNSAYYLVSQGVRTRHREEPFLLMQRKIMTELKG